MRWTNPRSFRDFDSIAVREHTTKIPQQVLRLVKFDSEAVQEDVIMRTADLHSIEGTFEFIEAKIRRDAEGTSFGGDFEWLCKWFLENAPRYRGQFDQVWLWKDWPEKIGPDTGIDIVARTRAGIRPPPLRPILPQPHFVELTAIPRRIFQEPLAQPLEVTTKRRAFGIAPNLGFDELESPCD